LSWDPLVIIASLVSLIEPLGKTVSKTECGCLGVTVPNNAI
jgi:hypothetical protein